MQKLLINIFLSTLVACGAKNKSGPSELLIIEQVNSQNRVEALFVPKLEFLSLRDTENSIEVKKLAKTPLFNKHFFNHYKGKFNRNSISVPNFETENRQFFSVTGGAKYLARVKASDFAILNTLTMKFYNLDDPKENIVVHLGHDELERELIDFEFETTTFSDVKIMAMEIVDFDFKEGDHSINHLQNYDKFKRDHYKLTVASATKTQHAYVSTGLTITEALQQMGISHQTNSFSKITKMLGVPNSPKKLSIWNFPEHSGIWEVINTPSQSLNYSPLGGENILIKWISVKDILEKVYRRESEVVKFTTPEIKIDWKGAIRVEILNKKTDRLVPEQGFQNLSANEIYYQIVSTGRRDRKIEKSGKCTVRKYVTNWKSVSQKDPHLHLHPGDYERSGKKAILKNRNQSSLKFIFSPSSKKITRGYSNVNCKRDAKLNYGLGTTVKVINDRLAGKATITRIYND